MLRDLPSQLASTRCIVISLVVTLLMMIALRIVPAIWLFSLIDLISDPEMVRSQVEAMTREQRMIHAWTTVTLDVIYPLAYGPLFAGLALRYLGRAGPFIAIFAGIAVIADLVEGFTQVVILHGGFFMLPAKAILTPLKYGSVSVALLGGLFAIGIAAKRRFVR